MKTPRAGSPSPFGKKTFLFIRDESFGWFRPALSSRALREEPLLTPVARQETLRPRSRSFKVRVGQRVTSAFTLLELLTVIAIIGIISAITLPNLKSLKPNVMAAASRQLIDDVGRARRLAISQRTTVYMVFVPPGFWGGLNLSDPNVNSLIGTLVDKQYVGYNFVALRRVGDQPGARFPVYLSEWRSLPAGSFIVPDKFEIVIPRRFVVSSRGEPIPFNPFTVTNGIPFPAPTNAVPINRTLPYIAFNYLGQVESPVEVDHTGQPYPDIFIPIALGAVGIPRDQSTKKPLTTRSASLTENPVGNSTNTYNIVRIDRLTGRARMEVMEIQ